MLKLARDWMVVAVAIGLTSFGCASEGDGMDRGSATMPIGVAGTSAGEPAPTAGMGSTPTAMAGASGALPSAGVGGAGGTTAAPPTAGAGAAGMDSTVGGTAGIGGTAGTAPIAGSSAAGGAGAMALPPRPTMPCLAAGDDVLVVGDSYVNYINPLVPPLEANATEDGQLPAGQSYDNRAVPGAFMANVAGQWQAAKGSSPVFVVMDGGGNDVLLGAPQCLGAGAHMDPGCTSVVDGALETGRTMMADIKASGVKGVVYFFYPHIPAGGDDILDYAYPLARELCEGASDATFTCAFVDTRAAFEGHPDYIFIDGIHPSASGAVVLADLVWAAMKDNCIAQTSGCCM